MRALFVTLDGPKGTGKSTLLAALHATLASRASVRAIVERDLDPQRATIHALLERHRGKMTAPAEEEIVGLLALGRAHITRTVLEPAAEDIVLCDRWYPSDAAFRCFVPVERSREAALAAGAAEPNLVLATSCAPEESWRRAAARERGLDSRVVASFADHARSSHRFEEAAVRLGWTLVPTDAPPAVLSARVAETVLEALARHRT